MNVHIVPLIGGIIFGCVGLFILFDYYRFNRKAQAVQGVIMGYEHVLSKPDKGAAKVGYKPRFAFSVNGKRYEVQSSTTFDYQIIAVGQPAKVFYDVNNPNNARLAKERGYWLGLLFIFLACPAIYLGWQG